MTFSLAQPRQLDAYTSPVAALSKDGLSRAGSILLTENGKLKPYGFGQEPLEAAALFDKFVAIYNSHETAARHSFVNVTLWSDRKYDRRRFTYGPTMRHLDVDMAGTVPVFVLICRPQNRESSARIEYDNAAPASALLVIDHATIMVIGQEPGLLGKRRVIEVDVECVIIDTASQVHLFA